MEGRGLTVMLCSSLNDEEYTLIDLKFNSVNDFSRL
jgi:hypothetical protein